MRTGSNLTAAKIAATYAGSIIGAGFASGQEMLQFFVSYGAQGLYGILLCGILFAWLGVRVLNQSWELSANSFASLLNRVCGKRSGGMLSLLTVLFLFGVLSIMYAGAGTVFRDYFQLPYSSGVAAILSITLVTVIAGIRGIANANLIVTPLLTICTLAIGGFSLLYHNLDISILSARIQPALMPAPNWLLSAILYVSYNLVVCSTVLAPLGAATPDRRARRLGGWIGGITLALLAGVVSVILLMHQPEISLQEVPMLYLSGIQDDFNLTAYAASLLAAMYTTAVACLYGCSQRLATAFRLPLAPAAFLISAFSLYSSSFGFSQLIAMLFPIFGYAALWFTIKLGWQSCRGSLSRSAPRLGLRR